LPREQGDLFDRNEPKSKGPEYKIQPHEMDAVKERKKMILNDSKLKN
jgi:hypothetical protein